MSGGVRNLEVLNHFGLDLSFAYLQDATIILLTGQGARLSYADLSGSHLRSVDLGGSSMENARLDRTVIRDSDFSAVEATRLRPPFPADMAPVSSFLDGASFRDAAIFDTSFRGARMLAADFDGALLFRPDFTDAILSAATLRGTMLVAPVITGADLKSVDLDGAIVFGADALDRMTAEAAPGSFRADRYRMDPADITDETAHRVAWAAILARRHRVRRPAGLPAFRLARIRPLED